MLIKIRFQCKRFPAFRALELLIHRVRLHMCTQIWAVSECCESKILPALKSWLFILKMVIASSNDREKKHQLPLPQCAHPYGCKQIWKYLMQLDGLISIDIIEGPVELPFRRYVNVNVLAVAMDVKKACHKHRSCVLICVSISASLRLALKHTLCHMYCTFWPIVSPNCDAFACVDLNCLTLHIAYHTVDIYSVRLCDALQCEWPQRRHSLFSIGHHLS